jgi:acetolactate synthase I/II/III large subunit
VGLKYQTDLSDISPHYCHPALVMGAISRARRDPSTDYTSQYSTICVDVGDVTLWASLSLSLQAGSRTLYSERLGTMGYALNAAVAAILARNAPAGATVLAGDGGFQMSLQELATFQQMRRPGDKLLCVVFDNQCLGRVAFGFDNAKGCEMVGPDYVALAKAYGGDGILLKKSSDADDVIQRAMAAEGLYLIHVQVDPKVKADMATFKDNSLKLMNSG